MKGKEMRYTHKKDEHSADRMFAMLTATGDVQIKTSTGIERVLKLEEMKLIFGIKLSEFPQNGQNMRPGVR